MAKTTTANSASSDPRSTSEPIKFREAILKTVGTIPIRLYTSNSRVEVYIDGIELWQAEIIAFTFERPIVINGKVYNM